MAVAKHLADTSAYEQQLASWPWLHLDDAVAGEALEVQHRLAVRGQHRRPIPDLLVAATAIVHDATVLRYDRDFDLIAEVSDLTSRWIIPPGTGHSRLHGAR